MKTTLLGILFLSSLCVVRADLVIKMENTGDEPVDFCVIEDQPKWFSRSWIVSGWTRLEPGQNRRVYRSYFDTTVMFAFIKRGGAVEYSPKNTFLKRRKPFQMVSVSPSSDFKYTAEDPSISQNSSYEMIPVSIGCVYDNGANDIEIQLSIPSLRSDSVSLFSSDGAQPAPYVAKPRKRTFLEAAAERYSNYVQSPEYAVFKVMEGIALSDYAQATAYIKNEGGSRLVLSELIASGAFVEKDFAKGYRHISTEIKGFTATVKWSFNGNIAHTTCQMLGGRWLVDFESETPANETTDARTSQKSVQEESPSPGELRNIELGLESIPLSWIPAGTFSTGSPIIERGRSVNEKQVENTIREAFGSGATR